jgi:uncharacterized membrane protein required for colicin V production
MLIDRIILGLLAVAFIYGAIRGIVSQLVAIAGLVAAYLFAPGLGRSVADSVQQELGGSHFAAEKIAILSVGLGIYVGTRLIGLLIERVVIGRVREFRWMNRLGGGLLGTVKCALMVALALFFLALLPRAQMKAHVPGMLDSRAFALASEYNPIAKPAALDRMRHLRTAWQSPEQVGKLRKDPEVGKLLERHRLPKVWDDDRFVKKLEKGDYDGLKGMENVEELMNDDELGRLLDKLARETPSPDGPSVRSGSSAKS